jgi:hypothetical protein
VNETHQKCTVFGPTGLFHEKGFEVSFFGAAAPSAVAVDDCHLFENVCRNVVRNAPKPPAARKPRRDDMVLTDAQTPIVRAEGIEKVSEQRFDRFKGVEM